MNKKDVVKITDQFFSRYRNLVRNEMIPYQWKVLNDETDVRIEKERNDSFIPNDKSHSIANFLIAAGREKGKHYGWVFQDSDAYKWLEATAYSLREKSDDSLKQKADWLIDLIADAQEEDGYLDTYFSIMEPERKFKCLGESHELYCAGHFMEAAAAYYNSTGSSKALDTACRLADCIDRNFGPEDQKIHGCDGHEEIEIGLMKLYRVTGKEKYLRLSQYFVEIRGKDKDFFKKQYLNESGEGELIRGMADFPYTYFQVQEPVMEQHAAVGHAVRMVYLCTAMADIAASTGNGCLLDACRRIWRNIADRRMYITGGIGSTVIGESFTLDYDLPNDTMYCETCASIGLIFFARQMLNNDFDGEYGDVMERALYNTALAGMALDGKHFFYVNPLEAVPEKSEQDPAKSHVKTQRPQWLGCACCPPNLARLIASIDEYIYVRNDRTILINLFIGSKSSFMFKDGAVDICIETGYPWDGNVSVSVNSTCIDDITLGIRIPNWADKYEMEIDNRNIREPRKKGIVFLKNGFRHSAINIKFNMNVHRWYSSAHVSENIGKVALSRGPFIYCAEETDNGKELHCLELDRKASFEYEFSDAELNGIGIIKTKGYRLDAVNRQGDLYSMDNADISIREQDITLIPYYAWGNRKNGEMRVWITER